MNPDLHAGQWDDTEQHKDDENDNKRPRPPAISMRRHVCHNVSREHTKCVQCSVQCTVRCNVVSLRASQPQFATLRRAARLDVCVRISVM